MSQFLIKWFLICETLLYWLQMLEFNWDDELSTPVLIWGIWPLVLSIVFSEIECLSFLQSGFLYARLYCTGFKCSNLKGMMN